MKDIFESYGLSKINDKKSLLENFNDCNDWERVTSKSVVDTDGMLTDYTWYKCGDKHIFMFGDEDVYKADPDYADHECDSEAEAEEWFIAYKGPGEDEDIEDDYHGFFAPEEDDIVLTESYDNLPDWIIEFLNNNKAIKERLAKKNVNLKTAMFTEAPISKITKAFISDPTKIHFIHLRLPSWGNYYTDKMYIPGIIDDEVHINDRYRKLSNVAVSKLAEYALDYGYIDLSDPMNSSASIRSDRYNLKKTSAVDRVPGKGQHPIRRNVQYYVDPETGRKDYDNILSYDIEWITDRGYDKSGYPLDPDKYIRMLNTVGLDNYGERIDKIYNQIEQCRLRIAKVVNDLTTMDSAKYRTKGWGRTLYSDIGNIFRDFSNIVDNYQRLKENLDQILARHNNEYKEESIKYLFVHDGRGISNDIKQLMSDIREVENPVEKPTED